MNKERKKKEDKYTEEKVMNHKRKKVVDITVL